MRSDDLARNNAACFLQILCRPTNLNNNHTHTTAPAIEHHVRRGGRQAMRRRAVRSRENTEVSGCPQSLCVPNSDGQPGREPIPSPSPQTLKMARKTLSSTSTFSSVTRNTSQRNWSHVPSHQDSLWAYLQVCLLRPLKSLSRSFTPATSTPLTTLRKS